VLHLKNNALLFGLVLSLLLESKAIAETKEIFSPNKQAVARIFFQENQVLFEINFKSRPVIEKSSINILLDKSPLTDGIGLKREKSYTINQTYPWRGIHSIATNRCNGLIFELEHSKSKTPLSIELRAYDDAVAFRYIIPGNDSLRAPDENSVFTVPKGSIIWHHGLGGHYEDVHKRSRSDEIVKGEWIAPPMTYKLPQNAGYASITESALVNYSGMALQADGEDRFKLVLGDKHPISYPFRLRYSNGIDRVSAPAQIKGTITSPWRVVMIGEDLNALVNSDVVDNLCPPPDLKLFPQGIETPWIKPGRAVWKYLDGGANTFEQMKEFSRWAGELDFEYHVIEGFWSRWSDEQIKELVDYSRQQGVGLWLWRHSKELRTPEAQDAFFKRLHDLGVVGAKIDFFDHEHREIVDLYQTLLKKAAENKIMVNFHGANKPTGEARTWPNELIREGVRGMESSRLKARALHDTTLPFTRYLAGPADYTPVHFGARRGDTTIAHQIATAAVFNEPLLTYGAHPTNLLNSPCLPMIKSIPAVWDETVVLPVSEIGEIAAFARRSGITWFVAILNGPEARNLELSLGFLPKGNVHSLIVRDKIDDPAQVDVEQKQISSSDTLKINLAAGGGFIARFGN
jgi:alpha-glucosidase